MFKISIITVVRNDLSGLKKTEVSILNQTYSKYEWVVIDGNSNDGTKEYVNNLNHDFIYSQSEKDKGIYDAMNKGIKYSTGDYLIFLNAGDEFYDNETLELVNYQLNISDADVLFGGADIYFNKDHFIYRPPLNINECISFSLPGHHQATYYSKHILNKIQYPSDYKHSGDYALICLLYNNGISTTILNKPLVKFVVGHNSFENIFKILYFSTKIQKNILQSNYCTILKSFLRRLFSTFSVQFFYKFPFFLSFIKGVNKCKF
jgi:putative colanic acid biosynthesis glycosyltransferase